MTLHNAPVHTIPFRRLHRGVAKQKTGSVRIRLDIHGRGGRTWDEDRRGAGFSMPARLGHRFTAYQTRLALTRILSRPVPQTRLNTFPSFTARVAEPNLHKPLASSRHGRESLPFSLGLKSALILHPTIAANCLWTLLIIGDGNKRCVTESTTMRSQRSALHPG